MNIFRAIKEFFYPDMYAAGFKYVMENWPCIGNLNAFLIDLHTVEIMAGGGEYEDGMHDAVKYLQDKPSEYRKPEKVKKEELLRH